MDLFDVLVEVKIYLFNLLSVRSKTFCKVEFHVRGLFSFLHHNALNFNLFFGFLHLIDNPRARITSFYYSYESLALFLLIQTGLESYTCDYFETFKRLVVKQDSSASRV